MLKFLALILLSVLSITVAAEDYFYGLNYGVDPNACPSYETIKAEFQEIQKYTNRVRTFSLSVCNEGAFALQAANELGMRIYLGMWVDRPDTFDAEMAALNAILANAQQQPLTNVDAIIVGSEVLYRKDTDETTLANYIGTVSGLVKPKGVDVTTADVYYEFPPAIVAKVDFLMMNAFPYWEGVTVDQGASTLMAHYDSVVEKANGKPVRISETGWPSSGDNFGNAVASPANQKLYLSNVLCVTRQRNIDMIYFSARDEPYKTGVEAYWGIMYSNFTLKSDLSTALLANPC